MGRQAPKIAFELEKKLDALDRQDAQDSIMKYRLQGYENFVGWDDKHQKLRAEIQKKYLEYSTSQKARASTPCMRKHAERHTSRSSFERR